MKKILAFSVIAGLFSCAPPKEAQEGHSSATVLDPGTPVGSSQADDQEALSLLIEEYAPRYVMVIPSGKATDEELDAFKNVLIDEAIKDQRADEGLGLFKPIDTGSSGKTLGGGGIDTGSSKKVFQDKPIDTNGVAKAISLPMEDMPSKGVYARVPDRMGNSASATDFQTKIIANTKAQKGLDYSRISDTPDGEFLKSVKREDNIGREIGTDMKKRDSEIKAWDSDLEESYLRWRRAADKLKNDQPSLAKQDVTARRTKVSSLSAQFNQQLELRNKIVEAKSSLTSHSYDGVGPKGLERTDIRTRVTLTPRVVTARPADSVSVPNSRDVEVARVKTNTADDAEIESMLEEFGIE